MKTALLIALAVLAFGTLHASRVIDDETMLGDVDQYSPYHPQDRMVQFTVKKSGVDFCIHNGEWRLMKGDICEPEETFADRMKKAAERSEEARSLKERYKKMTQEQREEARRKKKRELLAGPGLPRWYIRDFMALY